MFYLAMRWKLVVVDSVFYFYNCNLEPGIKGLQKVAVGARLQRCLSNSCDCQVRLSNLCILAEQTRLAWRQEFRSVHYASSVWLVVAGLRRIRIFRNLSETTLHRATSQWFQQKMWPPSWCLWILTTGKGSFFRRNGRDNKCSMRLLEQGTGSFKRAK